MPAALIEQTRPGGRIVAVVPTGVVGLDKHEDGSASGHYHEDVFGFMVMRGRHMPLPPPSDDTSALPRAAETRRWRFPPAVLGAAGRSLPFALLAHTAAMPYVYATWGGATTEVKACIGATDRG